MIYEIRMHLHRRMSASEFAAIESAGAFVVQENISRRKTHDIAIIHYHIGALQNCDIVKLAEILRGIE